jgi:hypothetical protein
VQLRRTQTLAAVAKASPVQHRWVLRRVRLLDRACALGDAVLIPTHTTPLVARSEAAPPGSPRGHAREEFS